MESPADFVVNSGRLVAIFGQWPSFHDAEVIEFNLWRGDMKSDPWPLPTLTAKIHLWDMTPEVDARGFFVLRHHTHATLRFHDIRDLRMDDFNHQNAIYGMSIVRETQTEGSLPRLKITFSGAHGMSADFTCVSAEVINAEPAPLAV